MALRLISLAFAFAFLGAVADECVAPDCVQEPRPCAAVQVSTCSTWPHHCSTWKHGDAVYCTDDHICACKEGFCANSQGVCVEQPKINCTKKVSTCHTWPHHCSTTMHGDSVSCSPDRDCVCGEGTCKEADSEMCSEIPQFVDLAVADECVAPDCVQEPQPCANVQVSTCSIWPHHCSILKHGDAVYCTDDHVCACKEGFCANSQGVCVEQPKINCIKKVSTCHTWPHHCSTTMHGDSVSCSPDRDCVCGEGTCKEAGSGMCSAIEQFTDLAGVQKQNNGPLAEAPIPLSAFFALATVAAMSVGAAAMAMTLRRSTIGEAPPLLG